jgi:microcin C transport system permease protein
MAWIQHPLAQRRLDNFRRNRRARISLWLFLAVFFISCCADFIANDRPLWVQAQGKTYWPVLVDYTETDFGGDFEAPVNYLDPYWQELLGPEARVVWPLIRYSYNTHIRDLPVPAPAPPSANNWLGTDDQARDVAARVLYGLRTSILFALCLALGSACLGVLVGALQGYFGGAVDLLGQRFLEIWSSLPVLFLLIILSSLVTPNFWWLLGLMLLFEWTSLVDVVRAEFLRGRQLDYVRAAQAMGVPPAAIMWRHVLPNAMVATFTFIPFQITGAIGTLTALDFLGFGLPPGSASLGELVSQAKDNLQAPWLGLTVFVALSGLLTLLVFIGEGLRDAFDPRIQGR